MFTAGQEKSGWLLCRRGTARNPLRGIANRFVIGDNEEMPDERPVLGYRCEDNSLWAVRQRRRRRRRRSTVAVLVSAACAVAGLILGGLPSLDVAQALASPARLAGLGLLLGAAALFVWSIVEDTRE